VAGEAKPSGTLAMNRSMVWAPRLIITLSCIFGSTVELSPTSALKSKTPCDFLETWLSQDVAYIIPDTERDWARAQKREDCDFAVEQFWAFRDPTPDTINNEFKEEFYERIQYANVHFATTDRMGWRTDRGRVYIAWGPPDLVKAENRQHSFEIWHYLNREKHYGLEGSIEFEDPTGNGAYRVVMNSAAQRALSRIPNTRGDIKEGPNGGVIQIICGRPPQIQFKDLETVLNVGLTYNLLPFSCRTESIHVTESTALVMIVVEVEKTDFANRKGNLHAAVKVFGMVRRDKKRLDLFEGILSEMAPEGPRESLSAHFLQYRKAVFLFPGTYSLELAIKDSETGNVGTLYRTVTVP